MRSISSCFVVLVLASAIGCSRGRCANTSRNGMKLGDEAPASE